jgi:type I restriction enzyme M protein
MDLEARKRIDNARNVLVGKIPDPKAQVEQITTALIYKFMDDMDKEAQRLGGKASFFTDGYEKYAWTHILDPRLGGQERLNRYVEALSTMSQNPHLPQLFRTIFKDAFLPYRDPTTLNLFLKVINGFTYDHSENLGDAYEYLLSILGSQGDAGQFRTPRHIIDFMVRVVDPKKNETMLDPASGTAGFLISSYRHIIEQNQDHRLTPDEKERLAGNLQGYDISPDMVRIGLVNMYLHNFPNPRIYEYDTLASEEHWHEKFDICMANPPFMTPTGGVRPHKLFQIQANRSEVLFVDYIAEHLKSSGRAAVIVPEGIVFTSDNAYKKLRQTLVETWGLWAVVSLPAGLFQPYSGVKTSILFLDKVFAKKTDEVVFVKVQNDGFSFGAKRHAIDKNDLPVAEEVLRAWLWGEERQNSQAQWVGKTTITGDSDCSLRGERYRRVVTVHARWPMERLGEVCTIESGAREIGGALADGIPSIGGEQITQDGLIGTGKMRYVSDEFFRRMKKGVLQNGDTLLVKDGATTGKTALYRNEFAEAAVNEHVYILRPNDKILSPLLQRIVRSSAFQSALRPYIKGIIGGISSEIREVEIPVPRLDVQRELVSELDGYQHVIDGARQVIATWRPMFLIDPTWPVVSLSEVIESKPKNGYSGTPIDHPAKLRVLSLSATTSGTMDLSQFKFLDEDILPDASCRCRRGDIYLQRGNTKELVGTAAMFDSDDEDYVYPDLMIRVRADEARIRSHYLLAVLKTPSVREYLTTNAVGTAGSMPKINQHIVESIPIPLPALAVQQTIADQVEVEQALVDGCRRLIEISEAKISAAVGRLWNNASDE